MNIDMLIYMIGAFGIVFITTGLFLWCIGTKHFTEDQHVKNMPLEADDEE
jgi:nitrogen fixation-related uncharacterized protein